MMLKLKRLLAASKSVQGLARLDDVQLAVAALLVEAARMDEVVAPAERAVIERLLAARYGLAAADLDRLVERAEQQAEQAVELFQFTRRLVPALDEAQRIELIEMLWEVALADGTLDPLEDSLIRRIAGLVYVSDQERAAARQRVVARRGGQG